MPTSVGKVAAGDGNTIAAQREGGAWPAVLASLE